MTESNTPTGGSPREHVEQVNEISGDTTATWESLGLSPESLNLVAKEGYQTPTPVQAVTIPLALRGTDVIASAQTGTGKTASFVLPMVDKFSGRQGTFGLILAPTREIALQTHATIEVFGAPRGVSLDRAHWRHQYEAGQGSAGLLSADHRGHARPAL